jgi:hypothetical protein
MTNSRTLKFRLCKHPGLTGQFFTRIHEQVLLESILLVVKLLVSTVECDQLFVTSPLKYFTRFDDQDLIRTANSGKTVCDDERRPSFTETIQSFLDQCLTFRIERRCRLIKNQDPRIRQQRAIAIRCRCPPDNFTPRSPTIVS